MTEDKIREILQEHKGHLRECKGIAEKHNTRIYWIGALDCIDNISEKLGVELE